MNLDGYIKFTTLWDDTNKMFFKRFLNIDLRDV